MTDRLSAILLAVKEIGSNKQGAIWHDDTEVEWRAYNEKGIIHIIIEKEEAK